MMNLTQISEIELFGPKEIEKLRRITECEAQPPSSLLGTPNGKNNRGLPKEYGTDTKLIKKKDLRKAANEMLRANINTTILST